MTARDTPGAPRGIMRTRDGGRRAAKSRMTGTGHTNGRWLELARVRVPVEKSTVWRALLDKTEHPERYNPAITRAELLDHDPTVVLRRTWPTRGEPFAEYVRHQIRTHRVEYQRYGRRWSTAQAVVDDEDGAWLVYEVCEAELARTHAGIDAAHAERILSHLVKACAGMMNGSAHAPRTKSGNGQAKNGNGAV